MSMYTKDIKEPGQEIYFLNDDNIAFDKNDMSCAAGFNAVASQKEFTEVYSEVKTVSSDFYALSSNVETSAATLDGKIDGVSAAADIKFLPLSGGMVDHLSVSDGLTAHGLIDTDYVKTNSTGDITVRGANGHGSIDIQFEGGMNSISVNGASLSSYIRDSINELDVETVKAGAGKIFDEIKQRDGKISATLRDLVSADIPVLPVSKISCLEDDYATKVYADSHISAFTLRNDGENRALWLTNNEVGLHISVDTNNFIKDGMINSVLTANGGTGLDGRVYPSEEGPYIWIKWNIESGTTDTWLKIKDFANLYGSGDPGVKVEDFKILLDYDVVAKAAVVSDLVDYATELSTPATGIIDTLSAGVDSALSSTALTVKFLGHITIYADETRRSFMQILEDEQLFDEQRRVKNGSMYQVTYLNSSGEPVGSESRYQTTDGLVLGDGDYVYVHKHGLDTYVQADEIAVTGDNKTVYLADPVHRYDIAELRQFVIDNFVKLSGNNEIEGGNLFHGVNSFDSEISVVGDLSVGFDKLFDLRDGKSLNDLSCEISSEIEELSAALSGEIDTLSAKLSGEIDSLSVALSGEIDTLSAKLSGEIDNLSAALSGEIDTLSAKLSGEIDSLSVALSGEIDTLSAKLSGEIDNLSAALSGEIDTLSAKLSGEIDNLSAALSGEIDTLSAKLSGEIDSLSVVLSGEIDTLSAKLSGEIDSLSVALSGEIDTLSAKLSGEIDSLSVVLSGEISARAMISVDEIPTNEFKFQHISRDEYHDLVLSVDGKTTDPNTLYVVSSDNTSMYGQKITDLADGELSDDACTYGQLSALKAQIKSAIDEIDTLSAKLSGEIDSLSVALSGEIDTLSAKLSGEIDSLSVALSGEIDTLSAKLSGEIDNLSAALSGEIDTLSAKLSGEIDNLSAALSGEIDTLSAKLSGEIDSLSVALSGEIDTLSAKLSGEIDSLSVALSGEIDTLSAKLSGEIDSLSVALSGEIDTLSAKLSGEIDSLSVVLSGEISARAMISVDEIPTNEFKFQHISRDEYHDLVLSVDGKTTDPNTLYVVSSDNTSMYGQKITDLADGELSDDACTYGQLSALKAQIKSAIDEALPEDTLEGNLTAPPLSAVVKCLLDIKTALA